MAMLKKLYHQIKSYFVKVKLNRKRKAWKKNGNINVDESVIIFPETSLSARTGSITIGEKSCIRGTLEIQRDGGVISIGKNCYVGDHTRIWAAQNIRIGDNVLIAHNVNIFDNDTHPTNYLERRVDAEEIIWHGVKKNFDSLRSSSVDIGNDAWISCGSIILKGVKIGERSIVGAGSVVTKDVPPDVVVGGNPARILKHLASGETACPTDSVLN